LVVAVTMRMLLVYMVLGDDDLQRCRCGHLLMARHALGVGVLVDVGEDKPAWSRRSEGETDDSA
jgi:hypothetical protein